MIALCASEQNSEVFSCLTACVRLMALLSWMGRSWKMVSFMWQWAEISLNACLMLIWCALKQSAHGETSGKTSNLREKTYNYYLSVEPQSRTFSYVTQLSWNIFYLSHKVWSKHFLSCNCVNITTLLLHYYYTIFFYVFVPLLLHYYYIITTLLLH